MSQEESARLVYSVKEAGRLLRISRGLMYECVQKGQIPSIRIGRRILIPYAGLIKLLEGASPQDVVMPGLEKPDQGVVKDNHTNNRPEL